MAPTNPIHIVLARRTTVAVGAVHVPILVIVMVSLIILALLLLAGRTLIINCIPREYANSSSPARRDGYDKRASLDSTMIGHSTVNTLTKGQVPLPALARLPSCSRTTGHGRAAACPPVTCFISQEVLRHEESVYTAAPKLPTFSTRIRDSFLIALRLHPFSGRPTSSASISVSAALPFIAPLAGSDASSMRTFVSDPPVPFPTSKCASLASLSPSSGGIGFTQAHDNSMIERPPPAPTRTFQPSNLHLHYSSTTPTRITLT
ncbi:hypothetical protein BKA62DRAFT_418630 [Auriculariales sp. MPI-PUGE-AT-0066]|nr:hypothetical protein BKA62DRAFT_418630 [Auriculariales sp. MPI-PUGE-AT-0066]